MMCFLVAQENLVAAGTQPPFCKGEGMKCSATLEKKRGCERQRGQRHDAAGVHGRV